MHVPRLGPLLALFRRRVEAPARHARLALVFAVGFLGAHVGRMGTPSARVAVAVAFVALAGLLVGLAVWNRRTLRDPRRALARVLKPAAPELAERALRALTLVERARLGTLEASPALAQAYLERLLERAPPALVEAGAARRARRWRRAAAALAALAAGAFVAGPMRIIEGLDVMAATGREAPLPLVWLDEPSVVAHPPAYLRREDRWLLIGGQVRETQGSIVSVRGTPRRAGRDLVLTDGQREIPFVSDGAGGVVARWTLDNDVTLRVAARFGAVRVVEPDALEIEAIIDTTPTVSLEGAPREVRLAELGGRLELRYEVADDHGLREVDLVLRSGEREDRRMLARLDGEARRNSGGYVLAVEDAFLRLGHLPTMVTIEARDNQPSEVPRWGRSATITVIPPPIGQPEANRMLALNTARDAAADLVARYLAAGSGAPNEPAWAERTAAILASSLDSASSSLAVPEALALFVRGQARVLNQRRPGTSPLRAAEDVALALDVAFGRLATRDAREVSQRLGDVAEEVATSARHARETEQRDASLQRLDVALGALGAGAHELGRLGGLGGDLGSVAEGDLDRLRRCRASEDLTGLEFAARHLAARLRRPNPSFAARRAGGVESAGGPALDAGEASQADQRFDDLLRELEQLAGEHATEVGRLERALAEAERATDLEAIKDEAQRRATELARAIADLPRVGDAPGTSRSAAARAREHASGMAQALERLSLGDAVARGRDARAALEESRRKHASDEAGAAPPDPAVIDAVKQRLTDHLAWAERELARLQRVTEERARAGLGAAGARERALADRASNVSSRGRNGQSSLPEDLIARLERAEALMRDAARGLETGKGREALDLERDAQRLLELPAPQESQDRSTPRDGEGGPGAMATHGDVPGDAGDSAIDFRRRVVEGLGGERSGRYAPAVRRYAEGLLR